VTATSIKVIDFDFETIPPLGINSIIVGTTTQTAKSIGDDLVLDFYMEERIGKKEPPSFWVQARHNTNNRYLFTKTNAINQTSRSTTALLISTITYQRDNETASRKHLSQSTIPGHQQGKTGRTLQGATLRTPKNKRTSLSSMNPTSTPTLSSVLETNPISNMSDQQFSQN
ncbi:41117_t:CDS:2, partial [Gigaspora margarita]